MLLVTKLNFLQEEKTMSQLQEAEQKELLLHRLKDAIGDVQGLLSDLKNLGLDIGVVVTDEKSHQGNLVRGTVGLDALDVTGSPVRMQVTGGMGSVPDAPSKLTYIDGNPKNKDIATLLYLGIPIAEIAALKIDHAQMAASYFETALSVDGDERIALAAANAKKKGLEFTAPENKYSKGIVSTSKFIEFNRKLADATYLTQEQFDELNAVLKAFRPEDDTMDMLSALTSKLNSMDNLQLGTAEQRKEAAIRSMAIMPVIAGMINAHINNTTCIKPTKTSLENFNYAKNFCELLNLPTDEATVEGMNLFLLLHLDHEMNASTTAVKGTMSADNRLWASLTSGVQTLHGKRHGGANFDVLQNLDRILAATLEEIQTKSTEELFNLPQNFVNERGVKEISPEEAATKISAYLDKYDAYRKENASNPNMFLIPGIGHRVYKKLDPRANEIKQAYEAVCEGKHITDPLFVLAKELEKQVKERGYGDKGLFPNVDFYSGLMQRQMGINARMMTVLFAVGRTPGWVSQGIEHSGRSIVRPFQVYNGDVNVNLAESVVSKAEGDEYKRAWDAVASEKAGQADPKDFQVEIARQMLKNAKQQAAVR